jgi:tRNA/rRNA methyltransferase
MMLPQAQWIRWVLIETSHPGNVGSTARALKTMGFNGLHLVKPKSFAVTQEPDAIALASGAQDVLEASIQDDLLETAVQDCPLVLGLTSRDREFGPPTIDWQEARQLIASNAANQQKSAILFGPERTGLNNHHLSLCTHRVYLDANPDYPSLNLAQAVMVCAFTLRETLNLQIGASSNESNMQDAELVDYADPAAVAAMLNHWKEGLEAIGYLDPNNPKKLMPRLQALFARSRLHKEEIDLLRGIAKQMLLRK